VFRKSEAWAYIYLLTVRGTIWAHNLSYFVAFLQVMYTSVGCTQSGSEIGMNVTVNLLNETLINRTQTSEEADMHGEECSATVNGVPLMTAVYSVGTLSLILQSILAPILGTVIDHSKVRARQRSSISSGAAAAAAAEQQQQRSSSSSGISSNSMC
jgi:hypothetical protein